jgi:hypothetical protein
VLPGGGPFSQWMVVVLYLLSAAEGEMKATGSDVEK